MPKQRKTLTERAYRANVLSDAALSRIESLEGTNLMPQNTDFEQLRSLVPPQNEKDSPAPEGESNPQQG